MNELTEEQHARIQELCARGDEHAQARQFAEALTAYWSAWDLLPELKTDWDAATWVLAAIGDANFLGQDYAAARQPVERDALPEWPRESVSPSATWPVSVRAWRVGPCGRRVDARVRGSGAGHLQGSGSEVSEFLEESGQGHRDAEAGMEVLEVRPNACVERSSFRRHR
jgi:hypothetical protein